jgi:hypothetical protein
MSDEEFSSSEKAEKIPNPNNIGEMLAIGSGAIETSPDHVYRSVSGIDAIKDLLDFGEVRNKASAMGDAEKARWGNTVYWSRGKDGKRHVLQKGGYLIVAPYDVAKDRVIKEADIRAVYTHDDNGEVIDIWDYANRDTLRERIAKTSE